MIEPELRFDSIEWPIYSVLAVKNPFHIRLVIIHTVQMVLLQLRSTHTKHLQKKNRELALNM